MKLTGYTHSVESCGTVDGPGIRFVVFMQGCPLRCLYCHNPDTWEPNVGTEAHVKTLMEEIVKYRSYMRFSGGGVTVSGGEPLLQPLFVAALFERCRENGIHTAIDTSGFCKMTPQIERLLSFTDLVLLDIKSIVPERFLEITGAELEPVLMFAKYLSNLSIPVWVRHVLVPGLTDDETELRLLARYLTTLTNVKKVEVIPFHKMGEYKWRQLGLDYTLGDVPPAHSRSVEKAKNIFISAGLTV
ncbi:MAG: pyruvate formate lyase-activating protein [Oscillospiraceae bacterium]|jgi:pyruvate formate lyase activating enzyme|nr:pyruvate formate lyase-activating protein [Oscillospiraceae bacterium]